MLSASWSFFIRKMEDQYVVLLERVAAENVRLWDELEARDNEQKRILADFGAKNRELCKFRTRASERASRKRKRKIPVPQHCRVSICLSWFLVDHDRLVCCYMCSHTNGTFHFLSAPTPYGMHFLCAFKYGPVGICNFCLDGGGVGIAILVITDPRNHFFSQSLFKFKNGVVRIFILRSGGVGISLLFIWELWEYLFFDLKWHQKWLSMWEVKRFTLQCTDYHQN